MVTTPKAKQCDHLFTEKGNVCVRCGLPGPDLVEVPTAPPPPVPQIFWLLELLDAAGKRVEVFRIAGLKPVPNPLIATFGGRPYRYVGAKVDGRLIYVQSPVLALDETPVSDRGLAVLPAP